MKRASHLFDSEIVGPPLAPTLRRVTAMSRFLFVTWDGAGNLVPTLALARRLARGGHNVRVLGHRSIVRRCGSDGWRMRPFTRTLEIDSAAPAGADRGPAAVARELWFSADVADDLRDELSREPADVAIVDCMLFGALCAAQASGVRTVALFHGAFTFFRGGPFGELLASWLPQLNHVRRNLRLDAVARPTDVHDACALSLVATPKAFEPPATLPSNVRFAGPLLDAPPLVRVAEPRGASDRLPSILVSLSTSDQGQVPTLRRLATALSALPTRTMITTGPAIDPSTLTSAPNVEIVQYVPHDRILPHASLVVTHAGLGTVMTSLAYGIPLLCLPFGRDQFFNAARVEALGVGRMLSRDAEPQALRAAAGALLEHERVRAAAKRFAGVIHEYRNGAAAVAAVEQLGREEKCAPNGAVLTRAQ